MPPPFNRMKKLIVVMLLVTALPACDRFSRDQTAAGQTVAFTSVTGLPLDTALALLQTELKAAAAAKLDDSGFQRFQRAESITDRLLETRFPFQWLKNEPYSVESKLRQIQSLADRIVAEVRSGMATDSITPDVALLQSQVAALRKALQAGGGQAPPTLERLLAGHDTSTTVTLPTNEPDQGH